jgi:hypothetical protein
MHKQARPRLTLHTCTLCAGVLHALAAAAGGVCFLCVASARRTLQVRHRPTLRTDVMFKRVSTVPRRLLLDTADSRFLQSMQLFDESIKLQARLHASAYAGVLCRAHAVSQLHE